MNKVKSTLVGVGVECRKEELNIFTNDFITKISADNRMLEKIVNTVLQSDKISENFKEDIIKSCGKDCFEEMDDNSYIWKGL